jgi:hypothetical protein
MIMNTEHSDRRALPSWAILLVAVLAIVFGTAAFTVIIVRPTMPWSGSAMSGVGPGFVAGGGMMGHGVVGANGAQSGEAGFVAGTVTARDQQRAGVPMSMTHAPAPYHW